MGGVRDEKFPPLLPFLKPEALLGNREKVKPGFPPLPPPSSPPPGRRESSEGSVEEEIRLSASPFLSFSFLLFFYLHPVNLERALGRSHFPFFSFPSSFFSFILRPPQGEVRDDEVDSFLSFPPPFFFPPFPRRAFSCRRTAPTEKKVRSELPLFSFSFFLFSFSPLPLLSHLGREKGARPHRNSSLPSPFLSSSPLRSPFSRLRGRR